MTGFPLTRLRRLRQNEKFRSLVRETNIAIDQFIYPLFISEEVKKPTPISAMPGISQWSLTSVAEEAARIHKLGIPAVLLFGIPKKKVPGLLIITDVCLCEYTDHGHCGVIDKKGSVKNDESLPLLGRMALSHVEAGADMVAPSDMMDGRVGAIRKILDNKGFTNVPIMAYSAKYASGFYGPFREAAQSAPQFGDRKSYQMDPANVQEALREVELDIKEGADIIMVKPALAYLDVITKVKEKYNVPLAAYNVSGEFSMVKAAAQNGWIDEERIAMEILTSIKRAGADIIISYFAPQVAEWLRK